jgi:hypothetical protein
MPLQLRHNQLQHPRYAEEFPKWLLVRDILNGKLALDKRGEERLPRPVGRLDEEYAAYQSRAVLYNATARTLDGYTGAIFRKKPTIEGVPDNMGYLLEDTDGEGNDIAQFAKTGVRDIIATGRHGLLVDYPRADNIRTLADEQKAGLKARIKAYSPESIVNWAVAKKGSKVVLSAVLLEETVEEVNTHWLDTEKSVRYRLLELDEDGLYSQSTLIEGEIINPETGKRETVWQEIEIIKPTLPNKKRLDYIPFILPGSIDSTPDPDLPPLFDLAILNLAHYRNSADWEEAVFMTGQPTPWISGLSDNFIQENQGKLRIGSRAAWLLPEGSATGLLESNANKNVIKQAMEMKELEMIGLGARLVQDTRHTGSESEQSVLLRRSSEQSILSCIADNYSKALTQCLKWASAWMGEDGSGITFRLNKDFFGGRLSHADLRELVAAWQSNVIPLSVVHDNMREGEIIKENTTNEQLRDMLETESPSAGDFALANVGE